MTSKRLGIVFVALVAAWGLAGPVGNLPIPGFHPIPVVGTAHAGDPDHYVGNSVSNPDPPASPTDSTSTQTGSPPSTTNDDGGRKLTINQMSMNYVSMFFWFITRTGF
jgi:hypothetical protein